MDLTGRDMTPVHVGDEVRLGPVRAGDVEITMMVTKVDEPAERTPQLAVSQAELEIRQDVGWLVVNTARHDTTAVHSRILGNLALLVAQRDDALRDWSQYVHEIEDETARADVAEARAEILTHKLEHMTSYYRAEDLKTKALKEELTSERERVAELERDLRDAQSITYSGLVTRTMQRAEAAEAEVERLAADLIASEEELASETARADGNAASLLGARIARETLRAECVRLRVRLIAARAGADPS